VALIVVEGDKAALAAARGQLGNWYGAALDRQLRYASKAGAEVLRGPLKAAAPAPGPRQPTDHPRDLRRAVKVVRLRSSKVGYVAAPMGKLAFHRHWVVMGTRPHTISHQGGFLGLPKHPVRNGVRHSGAHGNPYVAAVGRANAGAVSRAMLAYIHEAAQK
jgi:hypothetical protein